MEEAQQKALDENKIILLSFSGYDWCKSCLRLKKEIFDTEEFSRFASEKLILVRADFPRKKIGSLADKQLDHNEMLAEKYNPKGIFPSIVLLKNDGSVLGHLGYESGGAENYIQLIRSIMN